MNGGFPALVCDRWRCKGGLALAKSSALGNGLNDCNDWIRDAKNDGYQNATDAIGRDR